MFMGGGRASGRLTLDGDSNPRVVLAKQAVQKRCGAALSPVAPQPAPVPLAVGPHRCYISSARLRRASGANISPGPYRSFRELSLAGSVDPDIWCPPTFVGNSGIACFNGDCGFALLLSRPLPVGCRIRRGVSVSIWVSGILNHPPAGDDSEH